MAEYEDGKFWIQGYYVTSSTSNTGTFYPGANEDDGYTEGSNFHNDTTSNIIGEYTP